MSPHENDDKSFTVLTCEEVAGILRINERTVRKLAESGKIPAMKIGVKYRFDKKRLFEWLDKQHESKGDSN